MNKLKYSLILSSALAFSAPSSFALTISDYCDLSVNSPVMLSEITPLSDGESYAVKSDDNKRIDVYSYKSGKKTGELFNIDNVKGDIKISSFEGFSISDNGKKILLWTDSEKIYRYSFTAEYYVFDTFRNTLARVSQNGPQRGAVMSHDGRYVAYTRGNNIFISNLDYKTDLPITEDGKTGEIINGTPDWSYEEEFGILNTMIWNYDDTVLAYIKFNESQVPYYTFDSYRGYCSSDPMGDLYPERYSYKYPLAGSPNSVVSVHAYNLDNRTTKKMDIPVSDSDYIPSMKFDGEGRRLMVMVVNHDQNQLNLYNVNPASTVGTKVYSEHTDTWLSPIAYQMVKYGKDSFVIASEKSGERHLYQYDYSGNLKRQLTKGDFNVTAYYGADVKGTHYIQTTSLGPINRSLASVDAKGNLKLLSKEEGTTSATFSSNCAFYLQMYSSAVRPPVYTLYNSNGSKIKDIENNSEYKSKYSDAPKMEFLQVKNDEGQMMNAYIIKPEGFDPSKKYPLVMYQYNGPESQEVLNKWRMEGIFYLASKGYVVACVDGRGTGNRTNAWTKCVYKRLGDLETKDQLAGAKYFGSLPYVDESRMACFGWSYGGYMTMMELGTPGNPFKAGVSMAGVSDWRFYDSPYTERFMLTPSQNPSGYSSSSALNKTQSMKSKLLLISGSDDDNVHMYNTLKYASKLSSEGGLCDMMIYAGFEHSLRMCDARVQLFRKIADFLDNNLK